MSDGNYSFPHSLRIKSRSEFQYVFERGKVAADGVLVVHAVRPKAASASGETQLRIGLSIPKKVGNAPKRNLWKRLIREAFRKQQHDLPRDLLLVVRPRKGAEPEYHAICQSLSRLLVRLDRQLR